MLRAAADWAGPAGAPVSPPLADREDEGVRDGPHQFPVPIPVVVLVCLLGVMVVDMACLS